MRPLWAATVMPVDGEPGSYLMLRVLRTFGYSKGRESRCNADDGSVLWALPMSLYAVECCCALS